MPAYHKKNKQSIENKSSFSVDQLTLSDLKEAVKDDLRVFVQLSESKH